MTHSMFCIFLIRDRMGWINKYVLLIELTFVMHLKIHSNVLDFSHLHLSNMICNSCVTYLFTFVK
jgi:hypothetical protein